jgi:hypothetical protein
VDTITLSQQFNYLFFYLELIMAISRLQIESVGKGRALRKAFYIERVKYFGDPGKRENLKYISFGNMPNWCLDQPREFWHVADQYERSNAAVCREVLLTLPRELAISQNIELTESWVRQELPGKPYHYAIHEEDGDAHAHALYSDRMLDDYERPPEQFFRRFNPVAPGAGGARKGSGGKSPIGLRIAFTQLKERWDDLQNRALAAAGQAGHLDYGSSES